MKPKRIIGFLILTGVLSFLALTGEEAPWIVYLLLWFWLSLIFGIFVLAVKLIIED